VLELPQFGVVTLPTITRVGDGTITIGGDGIITFNTEPSGKGRNKSFSPPSITLTPTNNAVSCVYASYNNGNPVYAITTDTYQFLTNFTLVPITRLTREDNKVHLAEYDEYGVLLANKMNYKDIILNSFSRQSGLILSTSEGRISTVTAGKAVISVQWWDMPINIAGSQGELYRYYKIGGVW